MAQILAVDDDPRICKFVKSTLKTAGHEVTTVGDAESAFAHAASMVDDHPRNGCGLGPPHGDA